MSLLRKPEKNFLPKPSRCPPSYDFFHRALDVLVSPLEGDYLMTRFLQLFKINDEMQHL